jgi:hypothetical protein
MATDTTELTFVRCPECRSLVPAMSTRCRMCGAGLGTELKPDSGSTPTPPTSRVRQKTTTTAGAADFNDQIQQLRDEGNAPESEVEPKSPLDDFLEDDTADVQQAAPVAEDTSSQPQEPVEAAVQEKDDFDDFDEELDDLDDLDDFDDFDDFDDEDDQQKETKVEESKQAKPLDPELPVKNEETPIVEPKLNADVLAQAQKKVENFSAPQPKPRVVVEQGKGKFSKGLSFGAPSRFDAKPKQETKVEPKNVQAPVAPAQIVEEPKVEPVITPVQAVQQEVVNKVKEQEVDMKPQMKDSVSDSVPPVVRPKAAPVARDGSKDAIKRGEKLGTIFGWLVSYVDPNGSSIELREGRFFVSSTQLRSTDLVLEDETISTPHAMFTIGNDTGILVQDLKSDRGVFIRTGDATAYRREYDTVVLQHGDWVRFGDLEFLVSVIANVGAR